MASLDSKPANIYIILQHDAVTMGGRQDRVQSRYRGDAKAVGAPG